MEADLVPVEYRETSTRSRIGMMRRSYAEVKKNLTADMEDALNEIEVGFNCISGQMGYPSSDLTDVRGGNPSNFQDWSLHMADKVRTWRNEIEPKFTGAVIDYVVFGKPFKQIAFEKGRTRQTVSTHFYAGLNEYCEMYFK